jgi:outer membrane protein OmpA-like peptidoglycan-associated protein
MFAYIYRYDGTKLQSNTASRQIAVLCSKFFGVYLNVTSLRAINNTAVKNAAAHGDLNDTQLDEYNIECQGHTTRMGKKAYNHSVEPDRAKTLQQINDSICK